ncbi:MAG: type II toxin-antitoxin system VapC family toxin [Zoogloeaceae bacterium]|jgi:predicted nucleic-acid-binding protein|nr:type II toxin-antitoxin system VapC family toxin [Zoogloeaceae bacterium]
MTVAILDTNILARIVLDDDRHQSDVAFNALNTVSLVIIPVVVFCELVWVMRSVKTDDGKRVYSHLDIANRIRFFLGFDHILIQKDEVEAGLQMLEAGGDFADGVIQYTGRNLARDAAATFLSFDKNAVDTLAKRGLSALLLQ